MSLELAGASASSYALLYASKDTLVALKHINGQGVYFCPRCILYGKKKRDNHLIVSFFSYKKTSKYALFMRVY